jgi:putative two-component system response regulator
MQEQDKDLETEETLEVLDELEELDNSEAVSVSETESEPEEEAEEPHSRVLSASHNPFKVSIFPVLIIDRKLKIIYSNPACEKLFFKHHLNDNYFFDLFSKAFEMEDIKNIRDTVISGKNGYSWKGAGLIKSRSAVTIHIKVYIFPLEMDISKPGDFVVMFDDVTEENRELLRAVFVSLLEASKLKDNDTGLHITRVNYYSKRLAEELYKIGGSEYKQIDADFIDNIGFLASMHDVGKVGTPDDILNKEGPLSDWEWTVMREHTKNGAFILSTYPNPMAKEIALSHHEKWDGSGYPFQLEGDMIPLAARITTIADVYDALRMPRSYKPAMDHESTVERMVEASGKHFDPSLIEVFKTISDDFRNIFDNYGD